MRTEDALTVEQAAAALGKHPVTIRRMMATGTLPTVRDGGRVFIPAAAVEAAGRRVCPHCGKTFTPGRCAPRERYCSDRCRWASAYAARKAAHPATRGPGRPPKVPPKQPASMAAASDRLRAALELARQKPTA